MSNYDIPTLQTETAKLESHQRYRRLFLSTVWVKKVLKELDFIRGRYDNIAFQVQLKICQGATEVLKCNIYFVFLNWEKVRFLSVFIRKFT
jgi:hypothetical protein